MASVQADMSELEFTAFRQEIVRIAQHLSCDQTLAVADALHDVIRTKKRNLEHLGCTDAAKVYLLAANC